MLRVIFPGSVGLLGKLPQYILFLCLLCLTECYASPAHPADTVFHFTRQDSLRGSLNPARTCYDVKFYDLYVQLDIPNKKIQGTNRIVFKPLREIDSFQIDLFSQYQIYGIQFEQTWLRFRRDGNHIIAYFDISQSANNPLLEVTVHYGGVPPVAQNAPWDGGFVWEKDSLGKPWVTVACEGLGASSWWPCKDHLSDEPDSMQIQLETPPGLMGIANGQYRTMQALANGNTLHSWYVSYPINSYNVTLNVGDYVPISDTIKTAKQRLKLDYYVLSYHEKRARQYFSPEVKKMLRCFERYFGPYPFPRDGYALVETPYWGMEHQSAIAYGNNFKKNNWKFDFILVHESGHEWWGNKLSCADAAEMWLHESFTTYSEALYLECTSGYDSAMSYINMQRLFVKNKFPMIGPMGVNFHQFPDNDIYYKGALMLNTFRHALANDSLWFAILLGFQEKYAYRNVTTQNWLDYVNTTTGKDYTPLFREYLTRTALPKLEWSMKKKGRKTVVRYRWKASSDSFNMPVDLLTPGKKIRLQPTAKTQKVKIKRTLPEDIKVDIMGFYIAIGPLEEK